MNKYLEKIAMNPIAKWTLGGAGIGSLHYLRSHGRVYDKTKGKVIDRKFTTGERIGNGVAGAILGGIVGTEFGALKHWTRSNGYSKSYNKPPRNMNDIYSDLGAKPGTFRTKSEASRHYKKMAMKHHPDRPGGNVDTMKKVNTAWDEFKQHPNGFEKLAGLGILERAYILN